MISRQVLYSLQRFLFGRLYWCCESVDWTCPGCSALLTSVILSCAADSSPGSWTPRPTAAAPVLLPYLPILNNKSVIKLSGGQRPFTYATSRCQIKFQQVRQQDAYSPYWGGVKLHPTPRLPFHGQHFRRRLYASIYSTRGVETREWYLRQASNSNFGLLWPWPLTSWPRGRPIMSLPRRKIYANTVRYERDTSSSNEVSEMRDPDQHCDCVAGSDAELTMGQMGQQF